MRISGVLVLSVLAACGGGGGPGGQLQAAPLVGLAHLIVDLVETGTTLVENDLEERELVLEVSSVLVANRAQFKLRRSEIEPLLSRLRGAC